MPRKQDPEEDWLKELKALPVATKKLGPARARRVSASMTDAQYEERLKKLEAKEEELKRKERLSCAAKAKCCDDIETLRTLLLKRQNLDKQIKAFEKRMTEGWELLDDD